MTMSTEEGLDVAKALKEWFKSKDISFDDASFVATLFVGSYLGIATNSQKDLDGAINGVRDVLKIVAQDWFDVAQRIRKNGNQ